MSHVVVHSLNSTTLLLTAYVFLDFFVKLRSLKQILTERAWSSSYQDAWTHYQCRIDCWRRRKVWMDDLHFSEYLTNFLAPKFLLNIFILVARTDKRKQPKRIKCEETKHVLQAQMRSKQENSHTSLAEYRPRERDFDFCYPKILLLLETAKNKAKLKLSC